MTTAIQNAGYWIEKLGLIEHPEGGYYRQTYCAKEVITRATLPNQLKRDRPVGTAIYYLLRGDQFSAFHRILSDEIWHFYKGSALTIYVIDESGHLRVVKLGDDLERGEQFQTVIEAGCWFAALVIHPYPYTFALVGCTTAPGFDFTDFELGERNALVSKYPQHRELIEKLTLLNTITDTN